jgi:hypothetical protein
MNVQVTQHELEEIFTLEMDVKPKLRRIEELKEGVKALLLAKKQVELGRFDVRLKTLPGRHIPWKQGFIDRLGLAAAEAYRKLFPVTVRFDVLVDEHAVLPLWKSGAEAEGDQANR